MATYPIKMLKDEAGTPFVPLVSVDAVKTASGETIIEELNKELEASYYKKELTYSKGEIDAIVSRIEEEMNAWNSNMIARLQTLTTLDEANIETTLSELAGDTSE